MQDTTKGIDTGRGRKTLLREKKKRRQRKGRGGLGFKDLQTLHIVIIHLHCAFKF